MHQLQSFDPAIEIAHLARVPVHVAVLVAGTYLLVGTRT